MKPADHAARQAAIFERERNVLVDAGAGTGKTTLIVGRIVEMVAPIGEGSAVSMSRIAALSFTRRAAGDLRLKIREHLLGELSLSGLSPLRRERLQDALTSLEAAHVSTIHSFADRLLRLRPVEARLSPTYTIHEDPGPLADETFAILYRAAEEGGLAEQLVGTAWEERAAEAEETILGVAASRLLLRSVERDYGTLHGLDALIEGFILQRDVPLPEVLVPKPDLADFWMAVGEIQSACGSFTVDAPGQRWLSAWLGSAAFSRGSSDLFAIFNSLVLPLADKIPRLKKGDGFGGEKSAWALAARLKADGDLHARIIAPFQRWVACRLARLRPVALSVYEAVKARHAAVDSIDLLVRLRDLLRDNRSARAHYQGLFDHIFLDEVQDTDPLQVEIILYLAERAPLATRWEEIALAPGKLTLVGDPKQSIYRFRRADIAVYQRLREVLLGQGALSISLSASFRSVPSLIAWVNDRFERELGAATDGSEFDPVKGTVRHQRLEPMREPVTEARVHVLPFERPGGEGTADEYRALEADALAHYLRWLTQTSEVRIADPITGLVRRVGYGDVALLAISTWGLSAVFPALDRLDIPHAARGGRLFLEDPRHRRFLLALRAIADRSDGVAEAALFAPPFFALDFSDRLAAKADAEASPKHERRERFEAALAIVRKLRARRFDQSPGATALDLLEQTSLGLHVALGPNGAQRLSRLRELCMVADQLSTSKQLDFDGVTLEMRRWIDQPIALDPPHPLGANAIQILTVHQAKGLEFPVVILWDGKADWRSRMPTGAWRVDRTGDAWSLGLQGLKWSEPPTIDLLGREQAFLEAERKRVVYVAATRARDLLVLPQAGALKPSSITGRLIESSPPELVHRLETFREPRPAWAREIQPASKPTPCAAGSFETDLEERWSNALAIAARPRWAPMPISSYAHSKQAETERSQFALESRVALSTADAQPTVERPPRASRFGPTFGDAVHRAIGAILNDRSISPQSAVDQAARIVGLKPNLEEAEADVIRALETLARNGLDPGPGREVRLEYPVAGVARDELCLVGAIDLVVITSDRLDVIDFKTDQPPTGDGDSKYRSYAAQVGTYTRILVDAGLGANRTVRSGLLFTAEGTITWLRGT